MINKKPHSVVLLAEQNGKVLAVSRKDNHNDFGLVGGKIEKGESHQQALIRETMEETGLKLNNISHVFSKVEDGYPVSVYRAEVSGDIHTNEPHVVAWVPWKTVLDGSFGSYNKKLYNHLQKNAALPNLLPYVDDVINIYNKKKQLTKPKKINPPEEENEEGIKPLNMDLNKESSEAKNKDMELWTNWKNNPTPQTLSPLMKQIEPIVISETNRWTQSTVHKDLLEMKGKELAYQALHTFDPSKSQLNTHITNNLKHMSRYVINSQNMIRQPEEKIYNYRKFLTAKQTLEDQLGYEPTDIEVHQTMSDKGKVGDYKPIIENYYSKAAESGNAPVMDELSSDATAMAMLFDNLNDRHKYIFQNTHGYKGSKILSNQAIAKNLGTSPANISKHKRKIEDKYKAYITAMNSLSSS